MWSRPVKNKVGGVVGSGGSLSELPRVIGCLVTIAEEVLVADGQADPL